MSIHHTIIKLAAKQGVILTEEDGEITAQHTATNTAVCATADDEEATTINEAAKDALVVCVDIAAWKKNPTRADVKVMQEDGTFYAEIGDETLEADDWYDLLEAINSYDSDDEPEDDDSEEPNVSSVVPNEFKILYTQIGVDGQDNGDWLAIQMHRLCRNGDHVNVEAVERLAWANGIDRQPVAGNRGWEGRYRMTIANMLRRRVADQGHLVVPAVLSDGAAAQIECPAEFREHWATKPRKRAAKKA